MAVVRRSGPTETHIINIVTAFGGVATCEEVRVNLRRLTGSQTNSGYDRASVRLITKQRIYKYRRATDRKNCLVLPNEVSRGKVKLNPLHAEDVMVFETARQLNLNAWDALALCVRVSAARMVATDHALAQVENMNDGNPVAPGVLAMTSELRREVSLLGKVSYAAVRAGMDARLLRAAELNGQLVSNALSEALDATPLDHEERLAAYERAHNALSSSAFDE